MSINFKDLNLKTDTSTKTFKFGDKEIEVFKTLSAKDKYDLIMITLQKAEKEDGTYDEFLLDVFFHVNLVIMYTDIILEDEDKEDVFYLYDKLVQSGFMKSFLLTIDEDEYNELLTFLTTIKENNIRYKLAVVSIISKVINDLPAQAEAAAKVVENFDPKQFENIRALADQAGLNNRK